MRTSKTNVRLSKDIIPTRYKLVLKPDLDAFTFTGEETISLTVLKPTKTLTLHSAELEITSASLKIGTETHTPTISYKDAEEVVTFTFSHQLPKGTAKLTLSFAGILNDKMRGFYKSRYELDGKTYHMAVTQFESTDARRAFPCFDEPAHKAIFDVSLIVPKDRTAISNSLESTVEEHDGGYKIVSFAPSPKMSSYLVAFIVGHFEHIERRTKRGVLVRVFCTPGKKHQSEFALDCAVKCIDFYEKYFGIKYPLPVMDMIAIPDFSAGAMENWGAVTYRETTILVDPIHSSTQNRQRVALVIAHELAHQWFGNLVTMEWWTHLWLNEGFATYLEYVATNAIYPTWNIWNHFVYAEHSRALSLDALATTHAIEIDVHHPAEISEIFDAVSYAKGASVIRMLATYLGERSFQKGLQNYLKTHAYANAETADLWKAFEKASGKKVQKLMDGWTRKPGYPLITVHEKGKSVQLSQSRYYGNGRGPKSNASWTIPMNALVGSTQKSLLISKPAEKLSFPSPLTKLNVTESSLVRVKYPLETLATLSQSIASGKTKLSEADRFGIIRDAYALSESADLSTVDFLKLSLAYKNENSFIVWAQLAEQYIRLNNLFAGTALETPFKKFGQKVFQFITAEVGWKKKSNELDEHALMRSAVLFAAGSLGDVRILAEARALFGELQKNSGSIDADLRGVVYTLVAQNGTTKDFNTFMDMYRTATLEEEKDRIMRALCNFKDKKILERMLDIAFSEKARGQDTLKAINFIWSNPAGRDVAWHYIKKQWPYIEKRFGGGHLFSRFLIPASTEVSQKRAREIASFFKKKNQAGIERTVGMVVEQIQSNASWLKRDTKALAQFLKR